MTIKAIETSYKGYHFRSRLEARWAVFFDTLGVNWEYEREGYELGDGTKYLPDFWLPHIPLYVEIKPLGEVTDEAKNKAQQLAISGGFLVCLVSGDPYQSFYNDDENHIPATVYMPDNSTPIEAVWYFLAYFLVWGLHNDEGWKNYQAFRNKKITIDEFMTVSRDVWKRIRKGCNDARAARFEFGATPR